MVCLTAAPAAHARDWRQRLVEVLFLSREERWALNAHREMVRTGAERPPYDPYRPGVDADERVAVSRRHWYVPGNRYYAVACDLFPDAVADVTAEHAAAKIVFPERENLLLYWHPVAILEHRREEWERQAAERTERARRDAEAAAAAAERERERAREEARRAKTKPPAPKRELKPIVPVPIPVPTPAPPSDTPDNTMFDAFFQWLWGGGEPPAPAPEPRGGGGSSGGAGSTGDW